MILQLKTAGNYYFPGVASLRKYDKFLPPLSLLCASLYVYSYLRNRATAKEKRNLIIISSLITINLIQRVFLTGNPIKTTLVITSILAPLYWSIISFKDWKHRKEGGSIYMSLGWICILVGTLTWSIALKSGYALDFFVVYVIQVSTMFETMLISFASHTAINQENMKLNNNLEEKVLKRTHHLESIIEESKKVEKQIIQNQRDITQLEKDRALGKIAGGLAHEINNPLAIIKGSAQIFNSPGLINQMTSEKITATAKRIETASNRINELVDGLSIFAKSEKPSHLKEMSIVDLNNHFQNTAFAKTTKTHPFIHYSLKAFEGTVQLNKGITERVVNSLLENAIFVSKKTKNPEVFIGTSVHDDHLIISVKDNGGGIPDDVMERIFDPFFSTKDVGEGTGLGLSVAKSLIESQKGRLEARNITDGQSTGALFEISLPLCKKNDDKHEDDTQIKSTLDKA